MIEDDYISDDLKEYFEKEFYKWLKEGLKENPNLLIELVMLMICIWV